MLKGDWEYFCVKVYKALYACIWAVWQLWSHERDLSAVVNDVRRTGEGRDRLR